MSHCVYCNGWISHPRNRPGAYTIQILQALLCMRGLRVIIPCKSEKIYSCIMAYHFHMEVNTRIWMTDIGRITFLLLLIPYLSREISRLISQASNKAAGSKLTFANSGLFPVMLTLNYYLDSLNAFKSLKLCFVGVSDIILDFRGYFLFLKLQTR